MVAALSDRGGNPLGHRRNDSKGSCFTGTFEANGAGVWLSAAPMFAAGSYPVIGRFAIATGDPNAADASGRVHQCRQSVPDQNRDRAATTSAFPARRLPNHCSAISRRRRAAASPACDMGPVLPALRRSAQKYLVALDLRSGSGPSPRPGPKLQRRRPISVGSQVALPTSRRNCSHRLDDRSQAQ
jgi:hypothetical protein